MSYKPRKYILNEQKLLKPFTKEAAYILGLLWADSHLSKSQSILRLEMAYEDLITLKEVFESIGQWATYKRTRLNRKPQLSYVSCNPLLCDGLRKLNYSNRDFGPSKIIDILPEPLIKDFVRGWIDGDGCFYVNLENGAYQFSISAPVDQNWDWLTKILADLSIQSTVQIRQQKGQNKINRTSVLRITDKHNLQKLGNFIYFQSENCRLERKFLKYNEIPF